MYAKSWTYFVCAAYLVYAMASPDVATFFPQIQGNLSSVTWAHAVNNQSFLNSTLYNNDIMMIEADIVLGTLIGVINETAQIPVMGHPPDNTSDLSLNQFLTNIDTFNTNNSTNITRKGVKLDFKSIEAFNASVTLLGNFSQGNYPLWLNADILQGPINATTTPVNAGQFLSLASPFNNSVLSIGWTTNFGPNMTGSYTADQINSMISVIQQNNVTQNITFPVRAGLAAESLSVLQSLVTNVTDSTLSVWSSEGDNVNVTNLRNVIDQIGVARVYVDVPESLRSQLRLDTLPSNITNTTLAPNITTPAPNATTLAPNATTLAPNVTTLAPNVTTLAPNVTTLAPNVTTLAPNVTTPAPNVTTLAPNVTTPAPNVTTLSPGSASSIAPKVIMAFIVTLMALLFKEMY